MKFFKSLTLIAAVAIAVTGCKKPTANFTADKTEVETGEVVTFTNTSEDATLYMWDFGDGTQSTQKNPTHVYERAGEYQVTMTSAKKNNKKPADAAAITITVTDPVETPAKATFNASKTSAMPGEVITFTATDTTGDEYVWDFGDGAMSLSPNSSHVYQMGGTYTVTLTVYSYGRKYSDTQTKTITIGSGSGDFGVKSKLVGNWKIASHVLTHTINGTTVPSCPSNPIQPAPYNYTFPNTTNPNIPKIEVLSNGSMYLYDNDNNIRGTGSYNVLDATRMNWNHQPLNNTGGSFSQINGTAVPTSGSSIIWTITQLDATTLKLTYTYTAQNGNVYNSCTSQYVSGPQVITETVTYTKM